MKTKSLRIQDDAGALDVPLDAAARLSIHRAQAR
jgi:hypothetical protein